MTCLDLDSLRTFVAVVEAQSFSRGAEAIGRTQSAVSLQLAKLEKVLGKTLILRRQGRVLGVTDHGRELLPYARRMVDLNDAAYRAVAQPAVAGRVRLGVPADFMDAAFPDMLRAFQHAHGGVELEVVSDVSSRLRERVRLGRLDVAFFKRRPEPGGTPAVATQRLLWVGGATAPAPAADEPLPLALFPEGCMFRTQALTALEAAGRHWTLAYVCPSLDSVRAAIRAGLGIGVLPAGDAVRDLAPLDGLPPLGSVEIALELAPDAGLAATVLAEHVARRFSGS